MPTTLVSLRRAWTLAAGLSIASALPVSAQTKRPMTFLDVQNMRQIGNPEVSPDGRWMLYTLSVPDWRAERNQSDIYLVSTERGVSSTRQMTFTRDKTETNPRWSADGSFFVFTSDRDASPRGAEGGASVAPRPITAPNLPAGGAFTPAPVNPATQLYMMRPDGGEARKITDARDGISTFAFSKDGKWLVYRSGKPDEEQLYALSVAALVSGDSLRPVQITHHSTGVGLWQLAPDSKRIYFVTADTVDRDERARFDKRFDVRVRNPEMPVSSLWAVDLDTKQTTRLTHDTTYSVGPFTISHDGKWIGFHGMSPNRYETNILEQNDNADLYLLEVGSDRIERLTNNRDIAEGPVSFSPDSRMVAFTAPDDFQFMHLEKVYVRDVADRGGKFRKLGGNHDGDVTVGWWSKDGKTIYFNEGIKATDQLCAVDVGSGEVRQLTTEKAALRTVEDPESGRLTITYSDPKMPPTLFTVASAGDIGNRAKWVQLTDANPWVRDLSLGDEEEITWTSKDGRRVGGILVRPVGYEGGKRYPLIVAIHGGPAAADVLSFNGGYGAQVYAGAGYAVLMPNYRESTNYGQKFKIESQGDYFTKGYEDIMTGVDYLIAQGIVDSTQMGELGWSAGGHYSDWILTHTNRFKAISSGAGTFNWISMYGESDTQRLRQWYLGDKLWYDDMEHWWKQSPAAYIKNAKTPTFIHVVDGDPRVPRPQSEELHMALERLGVPTEMWVYPGNSHGIPDPRNRYLKSVAEMAWMDYWVRHSGRKFQWRDVLKSVEDSPNGKPTVSMAK